MYNYWLKLSLKFWQEMNCLDEKDFLNIIPLFWQKNNSFFDYIINSGSIKYYNYSLLCGFAAVFRSFLFCENLMVNMDTSWNIPNLQLYITVCLRFTVQDFLFNFTTIQLRVFTTKRDDGDGKKKQRLKNALLKNALFKNAYWIWGIWALMIFLQRCSAWLSITIQRVI